MRIGSSFPVIKKADEVSSTNNTKTLRTLCVLVPSSYCLPDSGFRITDPESPVLAIKSLVTNKTQDTKAQAAFVNP